MMIAFAPAEIRLRMSAICSAGPPFLFATITLLTLPLAAAWALIEQIISSRQPLPTSVFDTPSTYGPACGFAAPLLANAIAAIAPTIAATATSLATSRRPRNSNLIPLLLVLTFDLWAYDAVRRLPFAARCAAARLPPRAAHSRSRPQSRCPAAGCEPDPYRTCTYARKPVPAVAPATGVSLACIALARRVTPEGGAALHRADQ